MNTIFHVLDDEQDLVATVLFEVEPETVFGHKPFVGDRVWLGVPFNNDDKPYSIIDMTEEDDERGPALVFKLTPQRILNS